MPKKTIENITAEFNQFKEFFNGYSALEEIAPYLETSLRPVIENLYNRLECMDMIIKAAGNDKGGKETQQQIIENKKKLEEYDNYFANLDSRTIGLIEHYFENENHAEMFKNSAWSAAYNYFIRMEDLVFDKDLEKNIKQHEETSKIIEETQNELEKIAKEQKELNNLNIKKLYSDLAILYDEKKKINGDIENQLEDKEVLEFSKIEQFIDSYKAKSEPLQKEQEKQFIEEQKKYEEYLKKDRITKYIETKNRYEQISARFDEYAKKREEVPGLKEARKKLKTAQRKQANMVKVGTVFTNSVVQSTQKLYSKNALNKGFHINSKEFNSMIKAVDDVQSSKGSLIKMKKALENMKKEATKYLEAKDKQTRRNPSARRKQRFEYANGIIALADRRLKEMEEPEIKKELEKEAAKNKVTENQKVQTKEEKRISEPLNTIEKLWL